MKTFQPLVLKKLLLLKEERGEAQVLTKILELYENCSSQCINTEKSAVIKVGKSGRRKRGGWPSPSA